MKRYIYLIHTFIFTILFSSVSYSQPDSITMGTGYADDIFYSFKNGEVSKAARNTWDIAFFTPRFSAGIIINEGNGVQLYTYPNGEIHDWASIDTNGMANWPVMYNSPEYWEEGAFNANAPGHPDYGWGLYNMVDHSVYGDSLFVIKTPSGIKKLKIDKKVSIDNIYHFTYANLDGSDEQVVELDVKPFETKRFAYYSLENNEALDREPAKENWDILFTKYMDWTTTLEGDSSLYLVTGVTNNVGVFSKNFYPVEPSFSDWFPTPFDSTKNAIGYNWKTFDMGIFQWTIKDSNYYFVNTVDGDIYKLGFVSWTGSGSGVCVFEKSLVSLSSIGDDEEIEEGFTIYPNPTSDFITIKTPERVKGTSTVRILDQSGRLLFTENFTDNELNEGVQLSNLNLSFGIYIVSVTGDKYAKSQKLIVR